jgi:hypothetical protein
VKRGFVGIAIIAVLVIFGGVEEYQGKNTIKSHSYIVVNGEGPVYAPTDSTAYEGAKYIEEGVVQYSVFFRIACDVFYLFDHIQKPVAKLENAFTQEPKLDSRTYPVSPVEFSAGELIGYTKGTLSAHHFDFGLYDRAKYNPYPSYTNVEISERDHWSICPFDNFPSDMQAEYTSRFATIRSEDSIPTAICR